MWHTGNLLKWIEAFLKGRTQKVRVGKAVSSEAEVLSGIPQGSVLGPVLFTIFINYLPEALETTCKIFADDTKLYTGSKNNVTLQSDIDKLQAWSQKWNLLSNIGKCKVLHLGK